jgi:cytochrome P450
VLFELAKRPEHLPALKEELDNLFECDRSSGVPVSITYEDLRSARYLDSFIREVMRTKGDTLSTVRITTTDVPLGGYVIPKGRNGPIRQC